MKPGSPLLREIITVTKDGDWGKGEPESGYLPYRVIRGTDFPAARIGDPSRVPLRYLELKSAERRTLQPNDILIETAGGSQDRPTGRTLLVNEHLLERLDYPATCASFARFLRVDPTIAEPRFVYWFLQYLYATGEMSQHQVQHTGVARFQYTRFAGTQRIPLPSRWAQHGIAETLGAIEEKIGTNNSIVSRLKRMSALLFDRFLADARMSEQVDWTPLGELTGASRLIRTGPFGSNLHASDYAESGAPLVLVKHVADGVIRRSDLPQVNGSKARELSDYALEEGDIVVTRVGRVGDVALIHRDQSGWLFSGQMLRVRPPRSSLYPYWLFAFMLTRSFRNQIDNFAVGSTRQSLSVRVLEAIPVPVARTSCQRNFTAEVRPLWEHVEALRNESAHLESVRDALLLPLLADKLRIGDAQTSVGNAV